MKKLESFIESLPNISNPDHYGVYPLSINQVGQMWVFIVNKGLKDVIVAVGEGSSQFKGSSFNVDGVSCVEADLIHENGELLRKLFPFTKPIPVLNKMRSFGLGDRLGIAGPGHIKVFKKYDAYPVFVQQSIRELNLTHRTYEEVLDSATFYVYRDGYKDGFGADGDHLKKPEEIEYALRLGFTMITLDCSDYIRNDVSFLSDDAIDKTCIIDEVTKSTYLNKVFHVGTSEIKFEEKDLKRCILIYGKAIDYAVSIYDKYFSDPNHKVNFEISIDETATPTSPAQHYFVANELSLRGVHLDTMAPRFIGEFQKGVDYVGDIKEFEKELMIHADIARHFGYKLSIHSGSDKFSIFELIGKHTRGHFHVKTAGTNWLEAMRLVAIYDAKLYREIHKYALSMFSEAKKFYHVTTDLNKIADIDTLKDSDLVHLFSQNDARQLIHITYGYILNAKDSNDNYLFKDKLYTLWREKAEAYAELLEKHIGKHLDLLYLGFNQ